VGSIQPVIAHPRPRAMAATEGFDRRHAIDCRPTPNPMPRATLGDIGVSVEVDGPAEFPLTLLFLPYDARALVGIDPSSIRVFKCDPNAGSFQAVWNSGINVERRFIWAKVNAVGRYVSIGLPTDPLLAGLLRTLANRRQFAPHQSSEARENLTRETLALFRTEVAELLDRMRGIPAVPLSRRRGGLPSPGGLL
jgi:hypothetical protein